jgi:hypothetical protein
MIVFSEKPKPGRLMWWNIKITRAFTDMKDGCVFTLMNDRHGTCEALYHLGTPEKPIPARDLYEGQLISAGFYTEAEIGELVLEVTPVGDPITDGEFVMDLAFEAHSPLWQEDHPVYFRIPELERKGA